MIPSSASWQRLGRNEKAQGDNPACSPHKQPQSSLTVEESTELVLAVVGEALQKSFVAEEDNDSGNSLHAYGGDWLATVKHISLERNK